MTPKADKAEWGPTLLTERRGCEATTGRGTKFAKDFLERLRSHHRERHEVLD